MSKQRIISGILIIVIAAALVCAFLFRKEQNLAPVSAIPLTSVVVARTDAQREQGLSGKNSIASDTGMLFVFDHSEKYSFWMKDMKFPIDIIWLDENLRVVHVEHGLLPETYPKIFTPDQKSLFVLETASGIAQKNNYSVGQTLDFLKPYIYMK